jgi:type II secretory pathway component PulL
MNASPVYIEIGRATLRALRGTDGLDLPLERGTDGRLTAGCREKVRASLRTFVDRKPWQPRTRVYCAIGAGGVSLRRFSLPASARENFQHLLSLQIEAEFPVPPGDLAWGWQPLESNGPATQEMLVAAVRKEVVEDYASLLQSCGVNPVFTLAALARNAICPPQRDPHVMLDLEDNLAEAAAFEAGAPVAVRVMSTTDAALEDVINRLPGTGTEGRKVFLSGTPGAVAAQLARPPGGGTVLEALNLEQGAGCSAGTLGLKLYVGRNGGVPPLVFRITKRQAGGSNFLSIPEVRKWSIRAAALLCLLLVLPSAEALVLKPFLARKLARLNTEKARLKTIDQELEFLQYLKQSQPPYLDALYLFSKTAPQGSKIDSLTMNRRGDVALRGSMRSAEQVTEFRAKLTGSGFFSSVVVEEQSLSPDRQKVNIRVSAQWKPVEARAGLTNGPTAAEIEKARGGGDPRSGGKPPPGLPLRTMPEPVSMPIPGRK